MPTDSAKLYAIRAEELQAEFRDLSKALEASHENQRLLYQAIAENRNERRMLFENRVSLADGGTPPLLRELKTIGGATTLTVVDPLQQQQHQQQQQQQTSVATTPTATMMTSRATAAASTPGGGGGLIVRSASGAIRHSGGGGAATLTTVANAGPSYRLQQINPQQIRSKVVYVSNNGQEIVGKVDSPAAQKNIIYNIKRKADDSPDTKQMNPVYITKLPATKTLKLCPIEIGSKDYRIVSETNALPAITQKPKVVQGLTKVVKPPAAAQFSKVVTRTVAKIDRRKLKQATTSPVVAAATTTTTTATPDKVFVKMEYEDDLDMDIVEEPIIAPAKVTRKSSTEKQPLEQEPKAAATATTNTAKEEKSDTTTTPTTTKNSKKAAAEAESEKSEKPKGPEKKIGIWRKRTRK